MSNTNMDYLYPEFWASAFDGLDVGEYNLQNLVSRKYENKIADKGEKVIVPLQVDFGDADDFTPGNDLTPENITQQKAEVTLDISKRKTINLTAKELSLSPYELINTYGVGMVKSLLSTINKEIYKEALKGKYYIDATSDIDTDDITAAGTMLSNNEISSMGRVLVASPDVMGALMKEDAFKLVNQTGISDVMRDGKITRRFGFDFYQNNAISKYTPSNLTGQTDGTADAGDTVIDVKSFTDGTTPIRPGDLVEFFDGTESIGVYSVIDTTQHEDTGVTVKITIDRGLTENLADEDDVVIIPVQSALCMVPSAIAFAARTYGVLPDKVGVKSGVGNYNGLPVRFSVFHDSKLGLTVQADVLCGVKLVNDKRIVKIVEDL